MRKQIRKRGTVHALTPTISCFNRAETSLGVKFERLIKAMQVYIDKHVAPVWGTPAKLVRTDGFVPKTWALVFLDDAEVAGTLGLHDLTPDGLPLAKVFVKATKDNGDLVSVSASHELVEMLVDPAVNMLTIGPDKKSTYAYEAADPVEEFSFRVNGIPMSDFVYPSYFERFHKPKSVTFDHMKKVTRPFQILRGGYQLVFKNGKWTQIFTSVKKKKHFKREDRRGHRSHTRAGGTLRRKSKRGV